MLSALGGQPDGKHAHPRSRTTPATYALAQLSAVAEAHRVGEAGSVRGKLVLLAG